MIEAKNIHKYFDTLHVLKGVDLQINKSEIVSIVGASGVKPGIWYMEIAPELAAAAPIFLRLEVEAFF